MAENDIVAI